MESGINLILLKGGRDYLQSAKVLEEQDINGIFFFPMEKWELIPCGMRIFLTALEKAGNRGIMEASRVGRTSELNSDPAKVTDPQMSHPTGSSLSQQKQECPSIPMGGRAGCRSWICLEKKKSHPGINFSLR